MPDNSQLQQALEMLYKEGYKPEDVSVLVEEWSKLVSAKVYSDVMLAFSDEEMESIEQELGSDMSKEESEKLIKQKYKDKTGKDPDELAKDYFNQMARVLIETRDKKLAEDVIKEEGKSNN